MNRMGAVQKGEEYVTAFPKDYFFMREFWLGYIFYHPKNEKWSDFETYTHSGYFPELKNNPICFEITKDIGLILRLGKLLPLANLRVYDPSSPEGKEIGHYDDGHPFNFVFRWEEFIKLSRILADQVPECPAAPFILLSIFSPPTKQDNWEEVKKEVSYQWKSLDLFPEEFIDEEIVELYRPFDDTYRFIFDPDFGWYCKGEYVHTLRHPENPSFPKELFNELIKRIE